MATRFLEEKTERFHFKDGNNDLSYMLIYGDEITTRSGAASKGADYSRINYRTRNGQWKKPKTSAKRSLEMYFLDVGQGDAAFIVTPNNTKMLVDGGLRRQALGFLIWKYRLDKPGNTVTIDHLFLSHADKDHVEGLIPLLGHPQITVSHIHHNGIGLFNGGAFDTPIGDQSSDKKRLITLHDTVNELDGLDLASSSSATFARWIAAVKACGATYNRRDASVGLLDIGDPEIDLKILGPVLDADGASLPWFSSKSKTINGNSLVFQLRYQQVRTFFSGDLNEKGSRHLLEQPNADVDLNAHVFKAPHHGSHDYSEALLSAVSPIITVVSSGETPDHGHPRANFLAAAGRASRNSEALLFSTEIAALFVDAGEAPDTDNTEKTLEDLDFQDAEANEEARKLFKKRLPGIINVRSNGDVLYAFRRVQQSYGWEGYGPIRVSILA